jgi:threonine/homoserine/homoserine lactone efflux protein
MTFGWLSSYAFALNRVAPLLQRSRVRRTLRAVIGTVLVGFGLATQTR